MRAIHLLAALTIAAPGLALAQVGPNPAVNGSLDPTVGKSKDATTAPDDVAVGVDASASTMTLPNRDDAPAADANVSANSTDSTAVSPSAAQTKKSTAPTSESARKPR